MLDHCGHNRVLCGNYKGCMMLEAYIDGACEPINPGGTASYGVIVFFNGREKFSASGTIGKGKGMSNNVAEYYALCVLVEWLGDNLSKYPVPVNEHVRVYSDSKLVVEQMLGNWAVRRGLYVKQYERAAMLLSQTKFNGKPIFDKIFFKWVPRTQNKDADRLSKNALVAVGVRLRDEEDE